MPNLFCSHALHVRQIHILKLYIRLVHIIFLPCFLGLCALGSAILPKTFFSQTVPPRLQKTGGDKTLKYYETDFIYLLSGALSAQQTTYYIAPGGTGTGLPLPGDSSVWDNAASSINSIINNVSGDVIFCLKAGTYGPIKIWGQSNITSVKIFGGFSGNEILPMPSFRDLDDPANRTIIEGRNDGSTGSSYHYPALWLETSVATTSPEPHPRSIVPLVRVSEPRLVRTELCLRKEELQEKQKTWFSSLPFPFIDKDCLFFLRGNVRVSFLFYGTRIRNNVVA